MNNDNTNTVQTLSTDDNSDKAQALQLVKERGAADRSAQKSAFAYLYDMDAQEKKLKAKHTRRCEKALEAGDVEALTKLVAEARKHGFGTDSI